MLARWVFALAVLIGTAAAAGAQDSRGPRQANPDPRPNPNVDFDQKLGAQVPLDLAFKAADGRQVTLAECAAEGLQHEVGDPRGGLDVARDDRGG